MIHSDLLDSQPNDFDWQEPGDKASSQTNVIWAVEQYNFNKEAWEPAPVFFLDGELVQCTGSTRQAARYYARRLRERGRETRVVPYKACLDTKGRHNRQVKSERLDA
jgi:hypothetical protein